MKNKTGVTMQHNRQATQEFTFKIKRKKCNHKLELCLQPTQEVNTSIIDAICSRNNHSDQYCLTSIVHNIIVIYLADHGTFRTVLDSNSLCVNQCSLIWLRVKCLSMHQSYLRFLFWNIGKIYEKSIESFIKTCMFWSLWTAAESIQLRIVVR